MSVQATQAPLLTLEPSGHLKTQVGVAGVVMESKKKLVLQAVQVVDGG